MSVLTRSPFRQRGLHDYEDRGPHLRPVVNGALMETSIYLAKLMGPIYFLVGVGILLNQDHFRAVVKEVSESPALFYLTGVIAIIIGGLIIILNNVWSGWPLVITLIGWAAIAKGAVRLIAPDRAKALVERTMANENAVTAIALARACARVVPHRAWAIGSDR